MIMASSLYRVTVSYQGYKNTLWKWDSLKLLIIRWGRQMITTVTTWQVKHWGWGRTMSHDQGRMAGGRWSWCLIVSSSLWHWGRTRKACLDFSWQACHSQPECRWQCCDSWRNLHRFSGNLCWCQEPAECHSASPRLKRCVPRFSEQLLVY